MKQVAVVLAILVSSLLVQELYDWSYWLAKRLVRRAARVVSQDDDRERYEQEWLSELDSFRGRNLSALILAIWIFFSSFRVRRVLRSQTKPKDLSDAGLRRATAVAASIISLIVLSVAGAFVLRLADFSATGLSATVIAIIGIFASTGAVTIGYILYRRRDSRRESNAHD